MTLFTYIVQLAKVYRINPTEEQLDVLWNISDKCRIIYNIALADRKDMWHLHKYSVKYEEQQNFLPEFKKQNPEFNVVYSKVLQSVLKKLDSSYKSFFGHIRNGNKKARTPNFKSFKYFMNIPYNQSGFRIKDGFINFSHKVNDTELTFPIEKFEGKVKQVEIFNDNPYKGRGNFFISVIYEVYPKTYIDNGTYQAIDLGISKIITSIDTNGHVLEVSTPRNDKYWNPKIDSAKSRRDHCKKNSNRHVRINSSVRKMHKKLSNQNKDFQHKLSRKIVDGDINTIIVGDLNVTQMTQTKNGKKNRKLNRSTQGLGNLGRFVQFLTYKAELVGKKVIEIDERNTSKECCVCKNTHYMPLSERVMSCECGNVIDRDINSSINIMTRFLSQNAFWTGYQQFVGNLRKTGVINESSYTRMTSMLQHSQESARSSA